MSRWVVLLQKLARRGARAVTAVTIRAYTRHRPRRAFGGGGASHEGPESLRRRLEAGFRFLVNTHSHADHVYTNHLFPGATTVSSHPARERTRANQEVQGRHDAFLAEHFPDVDLRGGRYTPQDLTFSGSLTLHQGQREVRVLELGLGHSESDVVVHLPAEKIVFCGDVFLNGMPQLPGRGHVTQTIAHYRAIEALEAEIYVAGHGDPGTLADLRAQRARMEADFERVKACFERGLGYDEALAAFAGSGAPSDSQRMMVLYSYCELLGRMPEGRDPERQDHFALLEGIAAEARLALGRRG